MRHKKVVNGSTMRMPTCITYLIVPMAIAAALTAATSLRAQDYVRDSGPKFLSYDELVQLSLDQEMSPELTKKLRVIMTTPFINNEAYLSEARAKPLEVAGLGPSLRVALWNIERGLELGVSGDRSETVGHG